MRMRLPSIQDLMCATILERFPDAASCRVKNDTQEYEQEQAPTVEIYHRGSSPPPSHCFSCSVGVSLEPIGCKSD